MNKLIKRLGALSVTLLLSACGQDYGVDQHGQAVEAQGKWLIINYWATWCGPCRSEIPELNQLDKRLSAHNAKILGVNFDGLQGEALAAAAKELGIEFSVLATDPAERLGIARSAVLPITHIVDPQGQVRMSLPGEQHAEGLLRELNKLQE